jgi:hypothetical protein
VKDGQEVVHRRWLFLLFLGVLLQLFAVFNSDLGLDAHVRLNAISDERLDGQELMWGPLRVSEDATQQPSDTALYDGYIPPWFTTEFAIKSTSILALFLVAMLAGVVPRWQRVGGIFDPMLALLVLVSPVFLFATGRGYDEPMMALIVGIGVGGYFFNNGDQLHQQRLNVVLLATSLLLLMGWKGFGPVSSVTVWLLVCALGGTWIELDRRLSPGQEQPPLRNPWLMAGIVACVVYLSITLFGLVGGSGTFGVIAEAPLSFLFSSVMAILNAVVLFLFVGFALWPAFGSACRDLRQTRGPGITLLMMFIAGLLTSLVAYIAALWTLESSLWGLPLHETYLLLGNNGRYATCLLIPVILVLNWQRSESFIRRGVTKSWVLALLLLLPAVLFTSLHGQQLWSEDAGERLDGFVIEGDKQVLLVAPEALAMHHLYVLKTNVDPQGERGIDGFWRTPDDALDLLMQQEWTPDLVVVAPGVDFAMSENQWELLVEGKAPFTLTKGADASAWRIYRFAG